MLLTIDRRVPRGHLSKPTFDKARRTRRRTPVLLNPPMNADEKRVARAIEDGVRDARERVKSPRLLEAIRMRNPDEIVASVPLEPLRGIMRPIETVYRDQVVKAGNKAFAGSNSALRFATTDKVVIDAAATRAGALVQNITTEQLTSLRGAIVDAVAGQYDVEDTASIIRSSIGLTPRYQQAVARNFDLVKQTQIAQGASMRQANAAAEQSARRYADRLVRSRARTIAQTEVHQMNNVGKQKAWDDMFADGTILPDTYKVWVANFGACDICMGFNGEAVPVTQPFSNGNLQPEAHPNCRCTAEFESDEEYAARTGIASTEPTTTLAATPTSKTQVKTFDDAMTDLEEHKKRRDEIEKVLAINGNPANHQDTLGLAMNEKYGLDGKPQVVSADEFDALMKGREERIMYRAVTSGDVSQEQVFDQFKGGEFSARQGTYGDGTYFAARGAAVPSSLDPYVKFQGQREVIGGYGGRDGLVMRAAFKPDARLISYKDLNEEINKLDLEAVLSAKAVREQFAERQRRGEGTFESLQQELAAIEKKNYDARVALASQGHAARMLGYDGILVDEVGYVVVINRGSVIVQNEPDYNRGKALGS